MNDSMAQREESLPPLDLPGWKSTLNWVAAILTSLLFLAAGLWKITDPISAASRLAQARVPENLSLAAALLLGIAETVAAVLVLVPRFRKWGAWLGSALLVAFMIYIGANYTALRGAECNCFPWIKRAVGPGFFIGDAVMLLLAILAGFWARPSQSKRSAVVILCAVTVFALVSYGATAVRQRGILAPPILMVDGKPFSTQEGHVVLFFFDPECMHCFDVAKRLSALNWGDTKLVGVPTVHPQFAPDFLHDTGLKVVGVSTDIGTLKKTFPFGDPPYIAALENGHQKAPVTKFEDPEPAATLRKLGFVQ